ncbi:hypothetical protein ABEB36_005452 [Hypothenemus hampei]|uniref:Uncharacterized protein n=1 Tax=Hypothenemus hampei TaxID=57062 RepID=A0ABD1F0X3_HYPHA
MEYSYIVTFSIIATALIIDRSFADINSLQNQQQDTFLDPLQDQDQDLAVNNQDKRTICAALNNCVKPTYVKRIIIRKPQIVGYSPLVRPLRPPVVLGGYKYNKPKIPFVPIATGGWRPVQPPVKPVVEVHKPVHHVDVVHNTPVAHIDHLKPGHVHVQPIPAHLDHVHQINLPHGDHFDTLTHVDHVPVAQPVVIKPFAPSPVLFEVTRPNLGVLPLGSRFLTPILNEPPRVHAHHVHTHHVPNIIEYHGTRNYLPLAGAPVPVAPTVLAPPQTFPHGIVYPQQALPHAHPVQFVPEQRLPLPVQPHFTNGLPEQQLPNPGNPHFLNLIPEQPLPVAQSQPHFQQQLQAIQQYQGIPQGQLPLEGEEPQQQFLQNQGFNEQNNFIQPGQTDLQIPYHLPQHGVWNGVQDGQQEFGETVFKPSQQLEAPYHK